MKVYEKISALNSRMNSEMAGTKRDVLRKEKKKLEVQVASGEIDKHDEISEPELKFAPSEDPEITRIRGRMAEGLFHVEALLRSVPYGTKRNKLLKQRGKFLYAVESGREYTPDNPQFRVNTQDDDCRADNPRVKLHIIEKKLDHQLQPAERSRLNRKKEALRRKLGGTQREMPRTLTDIMKEL